MGNEGAYQVTAGNTHVGRDTMTNPMRRPTFRARIQWHTWMPWYEFSRIAGEFQDHDERAGGMLPPALGIALVTLVAAMLVPQLALLITITGGGSIMGALTWGSGDGRRLIRGVKVVGLPSPRMFLALSAEMAAADLTALWHGRPRPAGLLAGPEGEGWTREETIGRYHLWRQVREALPPVDRDAAAIAAAVGFAHEELMDALLAHKLRLADLASGRQQTLLAPILEVKMLEAAKAPSTALVAVDAGGDNGTGAAEARPDTTTRRDVAIRRPSYRDRQDGVLRPGHERTGRARVGAGQRLSPLPISRVGRSKYVSRRGQHQRDDAHLEATRGLIFPAPRPRGSGMDPALAEDGGHGDE